MQGCRRANRYGHETGRQRNRRLVRRLGKRLAAATISVSSIPHSCAREASPWLIPCVASIIFVLLWANLIGSGLHTWWIGLVLDIHFFIINNWFLKWFVPKIIWLKILQKLIAQSPVQAIRHVGGPSTWWATSWAGGPSCPYKGLYT